MANRFFTAGKDYIAKNGLSGKTLHLILLMTNTDVDTLAESSINFVSSFTLDECDGANYARKTSISHSFTRDNTNNRCEITFSALTWTAIGASTRQLEGALLIVFITNDAASIPLTFYDTTNFATNGGDVTFTPDAEGAIQI